MNAPKYDMGTCTRSEVVGLFHAYHGYKSVGQVFTYGFAVREPPYSGGVHRRIVAAYVWSPPARGAALNVCPEAPHGVLALSRMVAVPRAERALNHISKPLRRQMKVSIDRTRWPVLITYSDEGEGHTGHVYRCSGWQPTARVQRPYYLDSEGRRSCTYSNGKNGKRKLTRGGTTTVQRWEHWMCKPGETAEWMGAHGWAKIPIAGKVWASGNQAYKYVKVQSVAAVEVPT